ncbi:ABC transporter substrate-binding protein [Glutamicibacter sp. MNS18]|uniref:heme/hemin ABC transporter substrate-binding protein n=1 Tax=Glutamicibacter sp. MNS18 TaxID=2989817 RepID=UPI0022368678|nr:ABC transporter substrate-binding protein [Glutamicibacter sp. MNS18]MCW4465928.1 ABC transporter substrate-binding protein [Glutamicibacter sp. MNS18]
MPSKQYSRRARSLTSLVLAGLIVLTGCGSHAAGSEASGDGKTLESVTVLDNPKDHVGPSTAMLAGGQIDPVAKNPEPQLPVTITDAQDKEVTVTDISRILPLDLYGSSARIVYDLGLGDQVVGRDTSTTFKEAEDLPMVTQNGHELNAEAILQLAPTVIITDSSLGPWDVIEQMRQAGIPVVTLDSTRSLESAAEMITSIATALGVPEEGKKLAERTSNQIEEITSQIAQIAPEGDERLRMLLLYARGQSGVYYIFGQDSGADSLITSLGGIDVATEIGWEGMRPMTDEAMVEAEPDLVIMMSGGLESVGGVDGITTTVPALAHTPAGVNKRIVDMADSQLLSFGPNSAAVLEALSVAVYAPEAANEQ